MGDPVPAIAALPLSLGAKLRMLSVVAHLGGRHPRLARWGDAHPEIARSRDWCRRAWWGVAAGRLVRGELDDPQRRLAALGLVESVEMAALDRARDGGRGVIVLTAHLGPPKFLMHWMLDRSLPLLVWTNAADLPAWLPAEKPGVFVDPRQPAERGLRLVQSAAHLRRGGVLLAAADVATGDRPLAVERIGISWNFSLGLPALARRLDVPVVATLAVWDGCRVRVQGTLLEPPDSELSEEAWSQEWLDRYWRVIEPFVRSSPENLRFLRHVANPPENIPS